MSNEIKPIELIITDRDRQRFYELFYKKRIIFSSSNIEETIEYVKKKVNEGYYLRYRPVSIPGIMI